MGTTLMPAEPPGKMYAAAEQMLASGAYASAAQKFQEVDREHPYAPEARRALIMAAYAFYKAAKYPEAIACAQHYATLHPGTADAPLAHYTIAVALFDDIKSPARDQTATRKALAEMKVLQARYGNSSYAAQVENKMRIAEDVLAASEMSVGRHYQNRDQYAAAINRFRIVVADYQTTAHVEEALYRLVETNLALGMASEAQAAAAVLGHNYAHSSWYKKAYALLQSTGLSPQTTPGSWISTTIRKLVPGNDHKKTIPEPSEGEPKREPRPEGVPTAKVEPGIGSVAKVN